MQRWCSRIAISFLAAALALLPGAGAMAQSGPQWSKSFVAQQRSDDRVLGRQALDFGADGGAVLAAEFFSTVVVHRLLPGGGERYAHALRLSFTTDVRTAHALLVAVDTQADAAYVAISGSSPSGTGADRCLLLRLDAQGRREWLLSDPNLVAGACLGLAVAADGSLVVLRERELSRIARSGNRLWTLSTIDTARHGDGDLLLLDTAQRIVVARNGSSDAGVARYDLDGTLLGSTAVPAAGSPATVLGLDLLPNGDVAISGQANPDGPLQQAGFLSALDAGGSLRLVNAAATDIAYSRSTHDESGNLYVLTGVDTVRAFDSAGQLRWERAAREIAARRDGVLLVNPSGSGAGNTSITAVGASGSDEWTRQLDAEPGEYVRGAPQREGISRLLVQSQRRSEDCGRSAFVMLFDAAGTALERQQSCTVEVTRQFAQLSADPLAGVLGIDGLRVSALATDGRLRWEIATCILCNNTDAAERYLAGQLLADGGAWLLSESAGPPPLVQTLRRISSSGQVVATVNVPLPPTFTARSSVLLADAAEAVVLIPRGRALRWVRANAQGLREVRDFSFGGSWDGEPAFLVPPRRLANGDVIASYARRGPACGFGYCTVHENTILRFAADGAERWRFEATLSGAAVGVNPDGSALAVVAHGQNWQAALRVIDAQGTAAAAQLLGDGIGIGQLIGPSQGRFLATLQGGAFSHALIDSAGVIARIDLPYANEQLLAAGPAGFLLGARQYGADAVLLDAQSLAASGSFDVDGQPFTTDDDNHAYAWTLLADGSLYSAAFTAIADTLHQVQRSRLARFALPGYPAADRIFIDTF